MSPRASQRPSKPASRRRATKRPRLAVTLALAALFSLATAAALAGLYLMTPRRGRGVAVRVTIPERVDAASLASLLARSDVVDRPWAFELALRVTGVHARVKAGMIPLRDDLSPRAVLRALGRGGGLARVTIPEGYTRFDVARRLEAAGVCAAEDFLARTEAPEALARAGISTSGTASAIRSRPWARRAMRISVVGVRSRRSHLRACWTEQRRPAAHNERVRRQEKEIR